MQPSARTEKAFGLALRKLRVERGLSQEQLGLECGFDRTYISLLERGIQSPTLRTVFRLCDVLRMAFPDMAIEIEHFRKPQPSKKRDF